jgi:hypothetical protein
MEFLIILGILAGIGLAAAVGYVAFKAGRSGNAWWQRGGGGDNSWMYYDWAGSYSRHDPCDDGHDFDGGGDFGGGDGGGCDGGGGD